MHKRGATFYCFSPPVMLATFVIEIGLLMYTLVRYKLTPPVRVAGAILLSLAVFQLAEFNVCGVLTDHSAEWSRAGYVAITLLPPLGVHLVLLLAGKRKPLLVGLAYATGAAWVLLFGASEWAFSGHVCSGNYIIFQLREQVGYLYGAYYYLWIAVALGFAIATARQSRAKARQALYLLVGGYLAFLVPTAVITTLQPKAIEGVPSIMCGFAVLYAVLLAWAILPRVVKSKRSRN